ncbi:MAG: hypothetical protein HKN47_15865 [Pirellulaceae bacterium]|nr:hypothetical protein [Pirellulaceae bacterium]
MKNRILMVVLTATLLSLTTGCSGMRNFLFGRGARCGLCQTIRQPLSRLNPRNNQNAQVPVPQNNCGSNQCGQTYGPDVTGTTELGCGLERGCGLEVGCGQEMISNQCPCGNNISGYGPVVNHYGSVVNDPYLSGNVIDGQIVDGQIINGQIIDGGYPVEGQIMGDSWRPRSETNYPSYKVDADGHRIISEEPLPPGATPAT